MADIVGLKRIVELATQANIDDDVYAIIDSVSAGPNKYSLGAFICSITPIFDASESYSAGNYCNYNGKIYQFTAAHSGAWTGSDASEVVLTDVIGKVLVLTSSSFSSLPQTISNASITADHVVINSVLSNPAAQTGDWTVTTSAGSLTVSGTISGSTTLTLYLALKQ